MILDRDEEADKTTSLGTEGLSSGAVTGGEEKSWDRLGAEGIVGEKLPDTFDSRDASDKAGADGTCLLFICSNNSIWVFTGDVEEFT